MQAPEAGAEKKAGEGALPGDSGVLFCFNVLGPEPTHIEVPKFKEKFSVKCNCMST